MYDFVNEELFDLEKSQEYILSIQVSLGGFSFSVVSTENKLLALKNTFLKISNESLITRHLKEWMNSFDIMRNPFKTVRVIVFNNRFTLVPDNYYSEGFIKNIPPLLFSEYPDIEIETNQIKSLEATLIFALPQELKIALNEKVSNCEIIHPIKIITGHLPKHNEKQKLVLLYDVNSIYITIYNEDKILLANSFKVNHVNDVTYYILTTLKQLNFAPKTTKIFYAGKFDQENETIVQLKKYFNSINTLPVSTTFDFDREKLTQPIHHNLTLYC